MSEARHTLSRDARRSFPSSNKGEYLYGNEL